MSESVEIIDHDAWAYSLPRTRTTGKITFGSIPGVLPFSGARNPLTVSSTSQKVAFTYRTEANNFVPRVGIAESLAEAAVAQEALCSGRYYEVEFQPLAWSYEHPEGGTRAHTIDLRLTHKSGFRSFVFVRNARSLSKPSTWYEIEAIRDAAPAEEAHGFIVIDASAYNRAHRDNLRRMHRCVCFEPDHECDLIVEEAAHQLKTLWRVKDLFGVIDRSSGDIMKSCLRLIAAGRLAASMNKFIGPQSRIWRPDE